MLVKMLGGLGGTLGKRLDAQADSVGQLVEELAALGGPTFAARVYADARPPELHRDLRVLVNGRSIVFLEGTATRLDERDTVTLHLAGARGYPGG